MIEEKADYFNGCELVARLNMGDRDAFRTIFLTYSKEMLRLANKNIQSKEDCEEIIQDIFESLWNRRESLHITSLKYYLLSAVRHKVINYFKKSAVKRKYEEHYRFFEAVYDSIPAAERDLEIIRLKIEEAIAKLPPSWRTAITLRLSEDLSNQEIAERMNITKKTVESYMFQAFARIRSTSGRQILDA